eukprot:scaffold3576_cov170-Amphora_coffeaeformis.AAC.8
MDCRGKGSKEGRQEANEREGTPTKGGILCVCIANIRCLSLFNEVLEKKSNKHRREIERVRVEKSVRKEVVNRFVLTEKNDTHTVINIMLWPTPVSCREFVFAGCVPFLQNPKRHSNCDVPHLLEQPKSRISFIRKRTFRRPESSRWRECERS